MLPTNPLGEDYVRFPPYTRMKGDQLARSIEVTADGMFDVNPVEQEWVPRALLEVCREPLQCG